MVDDFRNITAAYSFGIADDVTWDSDISEHDIDVYMYDPTIDDLPHYRKGFHFYKEGITGELETNDYKKLTTFLDRNGHNQNEDLILKIDVEGSEWAAINALSPSDLSRFKQITGEFHGLCETKNREGKLSVIKKLCETHQPIWVHGNNFDYADSINEVCLPNVLEITFANRDVYEFEDGVAEEMKELTKPNWKLLEDFNLDNWLQREK